jgi:hypothetical protein
MEKSSVYVPIVGTANTIAVFNSSGTVVSGTAGTSGATSLGVRRDQFFWSDSEQ